ncbi:MAG: GNAT family N-acetyltransferase, partial [Vicinamibacterales bacterium]
MMNVAALTDHRPFSRTALVNATTRCISSLPALERELEGGLLAAWNQVMDDDPLASCFQSAGWCLPWYRAYRDEFDPYVLLVQVADRPVGVVPLSVHRATRELAFASGSMADYRDVVALPGFREVVVSELIRVYLDGGFPNPLQVGWIDPASNTPLLIAEACRARRAPFISWQQPCWRWFPAEGENLNKKFSRIRTHLNHFNRTGKVSFEVVTGAERWAELRESFFEQHSLRQLHAGRELAFDDPRRVAFYDQLFASTDFKSHVTALRVDGRVLAGHFGYLWRDVLLLGAPAIRLEDEQRSPAVILFTWIIQNAQTLGLRGFDLTVGDTDFKKRLANQCVHPTTVEVFSRRHRYYLQTARAGVVHAAKAAVAKTAGPDAWNKWVKPTGAWLMYKKTRVAESGLLTAAGLALRGLAKAIYERRQGLIYSMAPGQLRLPGGRLFARDVVSVRDNQIEDLLLWR